MSYVPLGDLPVWVDPMGASALPGMLGDVAPAPLAFTPEQLTLAKWALIVLVAWMLYRELGRGR